MKVIPLQPDAPVTALSAPSQPDAFHRILDDVAQTLSGAQRAEDAFANGGGSLQSAVYERARADVAVSVATAAAGRLVQSVQTLLNMQV